MKKTIAAAARCAAVLTMALCCAPSLGATPGGSGSAQEVFAAKLPDGRSVTVDANGMATIRSFKTGEIQRVFVGAAYRFVRAAKTGRRARLRVLAAIERYRPAAFAPGVVTIALRGASARDSYAVPAATLQHLRAHATALAAPSYTTSAQVNAVLARFGATRIDRLFRHFSRGQLTAMHARAAARSRVPLIDLSDVYRVSAGAVDVEPLVRALRKLPAIAYAEPAFYVSEQYVGALPLQTRRNVRRRPIAPKGVTGTDIPGNYAVSYSEQALLNAPHTNAIAAYDEIASAFGQLPGQGETIANVSIGDVTDASESSAGSDPCNADVLTYGPTTVLTNGQHYIDWPSMPLIPAYVADQAGDVSGSATVCGADPELTEVGLDFSMMAPLPDDMQRSGNQGTQDYDLLGIAPGAQYRLVVPGSNAPTNVDIVGALLAAAGQTPAPTVITMSLGWSNDARGFTGRFMEEDPLVRSTVTQLVQSDGIVVCISANDGTRAETNASIGPDGGSTATELATASSPDFTLDNLYFSTDPEYVPDSGSIDVGATTLDDIFSAPPGDPSQARFANQLAFPETRFNGMLGFSSGFGSRVDVSAPGDNVVGFIHTPGNASASSVEAVIDGGTSASAPEVAAAAAVVRQVARLTGHPFANPAAVRSFLESTGRAVPNPPLSPIALHVGPQIDLGAAVERLLGEGGKPVVPHVARVAIEQRRSGAFNGMCNCLTGIADGMDGVFQTDVDPAFVDMAGPVTGLGYATNMDAMAYLTIAPDWEGMPRGARYRLSIAGRPNAVLATTSYARLLPAQILASAGEPFVSASTRSVTLTYAALRGTRTIAAATFSIAFGPTLATSYLVPAPAVAPVVTGTTMHVAYDFTKWAGVASNAQLVVMGPGRTLPNKIGPINFVYTAPLHHAKGSIDVPVAKLRGDGVYGIAILLARVYYAGSLDLTPGVSQYSDFAFARVATLSSAQAPAPLLSDPGDPSAPPAQTLAIEPDKRFTVSWDVSSVPGARGAIVEFSSAGPTLWGNLNMFDNPNGSEVDDDGFDAPSVSHIAVGGAKGRRTFTAAEAKLDQAMFHNVRVIPLANGKPDGAASAISTIEYLGVAPPDGTALTAYAINPSGDDAVMTSGALTAGGNAIFGPYTTSVWPFAQKSEKVGDTLFSSSAAAGYEDLTRSGFIGSDALLLNQHAEVLGGCSPLSSFSFVPALASAQPSQTLASWTPPAAVSRDYFCQLFGARHSDAQHALYFEGDLTTPSSWNLYVADVAAGTASAPIAIGSIAAGMTAPTFYSFDYDPTTNKAYVLVFDTFGQLMTTAQLFEVDMTSGAIRAFNTELLDPSDVTVDPVSDTVYVVGGALGTCPDACTLQALRIIDPVAGTGKTVTFPSSDGIVPKGGGTPATYVTFDPVNKLVVMLVQNDWQFSYNNNPTGNVVVADASGKLVEIVRGFYVPTLYIGEHYFEVNGATRTGFVINDASNSVQRFSY